MCRKYIIENGVIWNPLKKERNLEREQCMEKENSTKKGNKEERTTPREVSSEKTSCEVATIAGEGERKL